MIKGRRSILEGEPRHSSSSHNLVNTIYEAHQRRDWSGRNIHTRRGIAWGRVGGEHVMLPQFVQGEIWLGAELFPLKTRVICVLLYEYLFTPCTQNPAILPHLCFAMPLSKSKGERNIRRSNRNDFVKRNTPPRNLDVNGPKTQRSLGRRTYSPTEKMNPKLMYMIYIQIQRASTTHQPNPEPSC